MNFLHSPTFRTQPHTPMLLKPPSTTQALIFDMDGTMIDSMPYHRMSWEAFIAKHGLNISQEEVLQKTTGRTGIECMRALLGEHISHQQAMTALHEKEALFRELFAPKFKEITGFRTFLAKAQSLGLKTAGGTAGDIENVTFAMQHLKLLHPLQTIVRGDEGLKGKPNPDIFLEGAKRLGVAAQNCIVFEDAPFGIEAARRAGMSAVAILSSHCREELAGEHVIAYANNYLELLDVQFLENLEIA